MANLRDIPELKHFDKASKERESRLQELEEATAEHLEKVEHYESVEQHLLELQRQQAVLYGERESLRGDWSEASFNGDTEQIEAVQSKRTDIDNQLAKVFEQIEDTEQWLQDNPLPVEAMAETMAVAGTLCVPSVAQLVQKIQATQSAQTSDLHTRQQSVHQKLRQHVSSTAMHEANMKISGSYRQKQAEHDRAMVNRAELERELEAYNELGTIGQLRRDPPYLDMNGNIKNSVLTGEQSRDVTKEPVGT